MDILLKIVQIGFYITAASIGILTYLKAKNGLLNTVNTEYQKKVIDRLAELSTELLDEFDSSSDNYWLRENSVKEILDRIHEEIILHKNEIISGVRSLHRIPVSKKEQKLQAFLSKVMSDPFIPSDIRNKILDLVEGRLNAMRSAHHIEIEKYQEGLKSGMYWDTLDGNDGWLHNKISRRLYKSGYGISDVESQVHKIRTDIQLYFEGFNPIKKSNK